jgi:hypothetical protein
MIRYQARERKEREWKRIEPVFIPGCVPEPLVSNETIYPDIIELAY